MENFKRKSPEEILYSIYKLQRGRLKIYIGPVSGSGKTYHMLREGQSLKNQGIDVVICAVITSQRQETVDQIGSLERVPSIHWFDGPEERKDLNLDALIKRKPEVVLVDGLAHRNRPGAQFPTRLADIEFLLGQGISVITTINVYEIEGIMRLAGELPGIKVRETVPAATLENADEVRLIDVTPETLLERLSEGHLQNSNPSLFSRGNLGKLRELALRLVAEDVNGALQKHRSEAGLLGTPGTSERILVSAQYHWNGSVYVRRGQQIAKRLGGDLLVVSFAKSGQPLSKEAATFKRSLIQLVNKVSGTFEELPLLSRRAIPRQLVGFALEHNVTRIVLGHSKQSRWQELWKGSVVNGLLRNARHVDLFFVADRAEQEGERIFPARSSKDRDKQKELYHRLSSQEVEEKIQKIKRGRLKVYIGAAPGVGKTYTMLREGNVLLKKGIDVVIGLLETHGRKETELQIDGLPVIEREVIAYRGTQLEEMNLMAILQRNPEVVLVDELAHTNVPGSKHKKRYEDVIELLEAGISVISTMNVQHLESLNDSVEQISGIRVRETVPDRLLHMADEVQLIDVTPDSLRERMKEGKIYAMSKVDQALNSFFKPGNLIALRELALRELADDVDERLESWDRSSSLRGPWRRQETIFVGLTSCRKGERLIRRGFRIAYRLKAAWYVTYIHTGPFLTEELKKRLKKLEELTERLGGTFEILQAAKGEKIARVLLDQANKYESTQIIVTQPRRGFLYKLCRGDLVKEILLRARHMDILVVADYDHGVNNEAR